MYEDWYYYNIWEVLNCAIYSSDNDFEKFYYRLNKPERFFPEYLTNKDTYDILLQPLMTRWTNVRCCHVAAIEDLDTEAIQDNTGCYIITNDGKILCTNKSVLAAGSAERTNVLIPILNKLGLVMINKVKQYEMLQKIMNKQSFSHSTTTNSTGTNRVNDTPNSSGNYSADTYTSSISQSTNKNVSEQSTNEYETYDVIMSRVRTLQQEIIDEMRVFEIWI